uniref:Reverse transcriptase Ty1/copia-type domain-containing protein n=1 Tax=Hyaloperonospora arabidopsidis (strain Emoy2) TaxID=559515 RepID=M4BCX1_HYAAE
MKFPDSAMKDLGVDTHKGLEIRLLKSLYGLKQAGRLWSQLLHDKIGSCWLYALYDRMCFTLSMWKKI